MQRTTGSSAGQFRDMKAASWGMENNAHFSFRFVSFRYFVEWEAGNTQERSPHLGSVSSSAAVATSR